MGEVAEACKHTVPDGGAEEGVQGERQELHIRNARRDRNQLADNGNEAAHECGNGTVVAEVGLCLFKLLRVQQQEMSQTAIGELVDDRATEELGEEVVDVCSDEGACACSKDNQHDAEARTGLQSLVGGGGHHELRRKGNERTFDGHQEGDGPVVQMLVIPVDNLGVDACGFGWGCLGDRIGDGGLGEGRYCEQANKCKGENLSIHEAKYRKKKKPLTHGQGLSKVCR